jgi:HlyD family secretion protein
VARHVLLSIRVGYIAETSQGHHATSVGVVRPRGWPEALKVWGAALLVAAGVVAVGTAWDLARRPSTPQPPALILAAVTRGQVLGQVRGEGVLEPVQIGLVSQPNAGRIAQVLVSPGDRVVAGQVLARFDPLALRAEVAQAEARLVAAEAAAFAAEVTLGRALRAGTRRLDEGVAAEDDGELADLAHAKAVSSAAEVAARETALRVARQRFGQGVVRAPMDGVIIDRAVEPGQAVPAGATLMRVGASPEQLHLIISVPERDLARVRRGQKARFSVPAFQGRTFEAEVKQLRPLAGPEGARHVPVVLVAVNRAGALQIGMSATASISVESAVGWRVPAAALAFSPERVLRTHDEPSVWTAAPDGHALRQVPVEVGVNDGSFVEVRSPELREGAAVAVGYGVIPR